MRSVSRRAARKLSVSASSQNASSASPVTGLAPPALLTRISTRPPRAAKASAAIAAGPPFAQTSPTTIAGRPPEQGTSAPATCSSAAAVRPLIATWTPASASVAAIPLPIPPLAAVMRAVLPSRPSFIGSTPCAADAVQENLGENLGGNLGENLNGKLGGTPGRGHGALAHLCER